MAKFDTLQIRAGYSSKDHNYAVNVPIYQTASFDLGSVERAKSLWAMDELAALYTRVSNPTVFALEDRVNALDGGFAAVAVASGMAAISYTVLALTEGGGNIIAPSALYGGSEDAFSHFLPRFGANFKFVEDRFDPESYESAIDDKTRGIYLESISNPNAELYDIEAIADIAHKHGIPLIIDNTVATPYLFKPFEHGADIIVYSATKGLGGHGNTIGGLILESGSFSYSKEKYPQFYTPSYKIKDRNGNRRSPVDIFPAAPLIGHIRAFYLEFIGAALSPFDAFLLIQGIDTLSERLQKQTRNAEKIAAYLATRDDVEWVSHPSLEDSPYKALAQKYFPNGAGGLLSFGYKGSEEQFDILVQSLKYFSYHVNIGDVRSLIVNSPKTTHAELDDEHLKRAGIAENTVRISAGLEDAEDLISDLERSLNIAATEIGGVSASDIDEITELEAVAFPPEKAATREAFEYRIANFGDYFLAARHDGKIVGIIDGAPSSREYITDDLYKSGGEFDKDGETLLIYGLAVHPDYREGGIAKRLMNALLEYAAQSGKKRAALTSERELIGFYEKLGYKNHGVSSSTIGNTVEFDLERQL